MSLDVQKLEQDAMKALQRGRNQDALNIYLRILQHDPRSRRIRKTVAELHLKLGQNKQAERRFLEVVESLVKDGQHRQAIPLYKELVRLRTKDHEMFVELAECQAKSGYENDALDNYGKAVEMTTRQKPDVAQDIQRKIILLKPADFSEKIKLAELLENANWSEKAADEWKALAEQSRQLGRPQDQARFLERAIEMKPDTDGLTRAAEARLICGEPIRSLEWLKQVSSEDKREPLVLELFGEALMAVGQAAKAQKLWIQAADQRKKDRHIEKALHDYRQAIKCGNKDPEIAKAIQKADEQVLRASLRLHVQNWAQPRTEAEMKVVISARVMYDYRLYEHAKTTLMRCDKKMRSILPVQVLLIETHIALGEISVAAEALQKLRVRSSEATEQVTTRLAVITGSDVDDELNDDYLNTPDPFFMDMVEEVASENDEGSESTATESSKAKEDTSALKQQAEGLVADGKINEAVDVLTKVLEIDPDDEAALIRFGELMAMDTDQEAEFQQDLQEQGFSDIDPMDFDPSRFQIGTPTDEAVSSQSVSEVDDDSIEDLEDEPIIKDEAIDAGGTSEDTEEVREARGLLLTRQFEAAAQASESLKGLSAAVIFSESMRNLGKLRQAKAKIQSALDSNDSSDPSYPDALWELLQIYIRAKKPAPAIKILGDLIEAAPHYKRRDCEALKIGLQKL
ncbi:MAG: tetratricopeptide repeat protein [Myxococcota bacterium]